VSAKSILAAAKERKLLLRFRRLRLQQFNLGSCQSGSTSHLLVRSQVSMIDVIAPRRT